eukprot:1161341-Pelagomonas_calceolata.AAC.2
MSPPYGSIPTKGNAPARRQCSRLHNPSKRKGSAVDSTTQANGKVAQEAKAQVEATIAQACQTGHLKSSPYVISTSCGIPRGLVEGNGQTLPPHPSTPTVQATVCACAVKSRAAWHKMLLCRAHELHKGIPVRDRRSVAQEAAVPCAVQVCAVHVCATWHEMLLRHAHKLHKGIPVRDRRSTGQEAAVSCGLQLKPGRENPGRGSCNLSWVLNHQALHLYCCTTRAVVLLQLSMLAGAIFSSQPLSRQQQGKVDGT